MTIEIKNEGAFLNSDDEKVEGFTLVCDKCDSANTYIDNGIYMGSSYTGVCGAIALRCHDCDNSEDVFN